MKRLKIIIYFFIISGLVLLYLAIPKLIKITKVSCQSQYGPCKRVISDKLVNLEGKSLDEARKLAENALTGEVLVKSYSTRFRLASTLEVNILERKPKFSMTNQEESFFTQLDGNGIVLSASNSSDLPILKKESIPKVGEKVASADLFALNIIYDLSNIFQVKSGQIENDSLVIELPNKLKVIFPLGGDREVLVGSITLLMNELEKKDSSLSNLTKSIGKIDLRFKNPVLK